MLRSCSRRRSLQIYQQQEQLEAHQRQVAQCLNGLATALIRLQGRYSEAADLLSMSISILEKLPGGGGDAPPEPTTTDAGDMELVRANATLRRLLQQYLSRMHYAYATHNHIILTDAHGCMRADPKRTYSLRATLPSPS